MLPLVHAVKTVAAHGPVLTALVTGVLGVVAGVAFVRRQRRLHDPLLDVTLFTRPAWRPTW